jgi:integrase
MSYPLDSDVQEDVRTFPMYQRLRKINPYAYYSLNTQNQMQSDLRNFGSLTFISSIRAVFNFAISEYALDLKNPFVGMYFDKSAGVSKRLPIPIKDIRKVQNQCRLMDDDLRWLVALVSDTGMRLAEGAGLLKSDIILDADIPHISLKPHPWRPLKTSGSQRDIPLVGASLWAAQGL